MNNLSEFDRIIKEKIDSFEYPYEEASWVKFKKSIPGKSSFWGIAAILSIVAISVIGIYWYLNSSKTNEIINHDISVNKSVNTNNIVSDNKNETVSNKLPINNKTIANEATQTKKSNETYPEILTDKASIQQNNANNTKQENGTVIQNPQKPKTPNATFACDAKAGCSPLPVRFAPSEISDTIIYSWNFGDGSFSTEKNPVHIFTKPGNYSVLLMTKYYKSEPVISNLQQNLIKIYEKPKALFSWNNEENTYNFENNSKGAQKYKWVFPDSVSNDENSSKLFKINGKYSVWLIATNINGCSDTATKNIEVNIKLPIQMADHFTPNGDGDNDFFGPQVENPNDYLFVFEIYNKSGQIVFKARGNANDVAWDGIDKNTKQSSVAGLYSYRLIANDKYGNKDERNGKIYLKR